MVAFAIYVDLALAAGPSSRLQPQVPQRKASLAAVHRPRDAFQGHVARTVRILGREHYHAAMALDLAAECLLNSYFAVGYAVLLQERRIRLNVSTVKLATARTAQ
jgi:hypothetical protein